MLHLLSSYIRCSLSMTILILVLLAATPRLSKKYAPKWIYYAWLIIVIGLIIPFRPQIHIPLLPSEHMSVYVQRAKAADALTEYQTAVLASGKGNTLSFSWCACLIWISGGLLFLIYHGIKHYRFLKMLRRWSEAADDNRLQELMRRLSENMKIRKQIALRLCPCIASPMLTGFLQPVILLPSAAIPIDELTLILRHEMTHYKRRDLWFRALILLAASLHWFNPFVYLMVKAAEAQCEISCDAEVIKNADIKLRQTYSEALIGTIRHQSKLKTAFSTNFYTGRNTAKNRIYSIMDTRRKKSGLFLLQLILNLILLVSAEYVSESASITVTQHTFTSDITDGTAQAILDQGSPNVSVTVSYDASFIKTIDSLTVTQGHAAKTGSAECQTVITKDNTASAACSSAVIKDDPVAAAVREGNSVTTSSDIAKDKALISN